MGRRFNGVLAAEWRGVLNHKWNSERPLIFANEVLTRTLSACKAREIWASINRCLDHWEREVYAGLVGDVLAEGRAREGCVAKSDDVEEDCLAHNSHSTFFFGKAAAGGPSGQI